MLTEESIRIMSHHSLKMAIFYLPDTSANIADGLFPNTIKEINAP